MSPDVTLCDIGAFSVEQVASKNDVLEDHCVAPRVLRPCRRTVSGVCVFLVPEAKRG